MKIEDFNDPYLGKTWGELGARVVAKGDRVNVQLGYPARGLAARLSAQLGEFLNSPVQLELSFAVPPGRGFQDVAHVIAVASGKGGVGKSTTAVNLALALAAEGASVGLLDADIYGPSQGLMLGVPQNRRPDIRDGKFFLPIEAYGLKTMSMSYLATDQTPMVWRGPMASGALQQMLQQTIWGELDYLIVDMPPGTGDIQLTLSQQAPVSGAVVVTTPQDIALLDARKAVAMFNKVDIPTLGIVENMSVHICANCGHTSHIFGDGGGARMAAGLGVPLIGELPLDLQICQQTDSGRPTVAVEPEGTVASIYRDAARHLAARIWALEFRAPTITVSDD